MMMGQIIQIKDFSAPELDVYAHLTEAQLRSRQAREKFFIAESVTVIDHALDAGYEPVSFLMEGRHIEGKAAALLKRCEGVPVYAANRDVLSHLTGYSLTRGVLCAMRRKELPSPQEVCRGASRLCILENVGDSTNTGAIFRSAAALGIDGVLLSQGCCDPLCRRSVRVSMGTVFQISWTYLREKFFPWPHEAIAELHRQGFKIAALALNDQSLPIDDPRLLDEGKLAVVLGSEGDGLNPHTIAECDYTLRIPMSHGVDSLNVAAASAVAFWQLRRKN